MNQEQDAALAAMTKPRSNATIWSVGMILRGRNGFGWDVWRVASVNLGATGQESVVEIEPLTRNASTRGNAIVPALVLDLAVEAKAMEIA